jgi:hypothetical protein
MSNLDDEKEKYESYFLNEGVINPAFNPEVQHLAQ